MVFDGANESTIQRNLKRVITFIAFSIAIFTSPIRSTCPLTFNFGPLSPLGRHKLFEIDNYVYLNPMQISRRVAGSELDGATGDGGIREKKLIGISIENKEKLTQHDLSMK